MSQTLSHFTIELPYPVSDPACCQSQQEFESGTGTTSCTPLSNEQTPLFFVWPVFLANVDRRIDAKIALVDSWVSSDPHISVAWMLKGPQRHPLKILAESQTLAASASWVKGVVCSPSSHHDACGDC